LPKILETDPRLSMCADGLEGYCNMIQTLLLEPSSKHIGIEQTVIRNLNLKGANKM
jgi:hypothetical protein